MGNNASVILSRKTVGPMAFLPDGGDAVYMIITAERGPINVPKLITGMTRFEAIFGGPTPIAAGTEYSSGYEMADVLFSKGIRRIYCVRITDAAAVVAGSTLVDRAGAPVNTLRVDAKGPGLAAELEVIVADGSVTNTFKLTVESVISGETLEAWDNLRMTSSALAKVNDGSDFITITDLASATAAPANIPATGTFTIGTDGVGPTAGVDGNAPIAADVVGAIGTGNIKSGLKCFRDRRLGRGWLLVPDNDSDSTVIAECSAITAGYFKIYLTSASAGATFSTASTERNAHDSVFTGFYWPRFKREDRLSLEIKAIPAVAHVIGDWAKGILRKGLAKAPAGKDHRVDSSSKGLETFQNGSAQVDEGLAETCLALGINPIWDKDQSGDKIWGARTASTESGWKNLQTAYIYQYIASNVWRNLQDVVFESVDDTLYLDVRGGVHGFLAGMQSDGAFKGRAPSMDEEADPTEHGFGVVCDESLLSAQDIADDNFRVQIWFRDKSTAETVYVSIAKNTTP